MVTYMENEIRNELPEEMRDSSTGSLLFKQTIEITNSHLSMMYGKIATDPVARVKDYFTGNEYKRECHKPKFITDIPEIGMDDICNMLEEEKCYHDNFETLYHYELIKRDMEKSNPRAETKSDYHNIVNEMAEIIGLFGNNAHPLYKHLYRTGYSDDNDRMYCKAQQNFKILAMFVDEMCKINSDGMVYSYYPIGDIFTQQHGKYYYRGENAFFGSSKAGLFRDSYMHTLSCKGDTWANLLRMHEGMSFLDNFKVIKDWKPGYGSVNYYALAQHYGLKTLMMDLTSDLKTALFFACCTYDDNNKCWRPLDPSEYSRKYSRDIGIHKGRDSRYALLYKMPTELSQLDIINSRKDSFSNIVVPIGHQPFMRCSHQQGYMYHVNPEYDMLKDRNFTKVKIRLNKELCNWIFDEMDCGNKVYPYNDIPDISDEFARINKAKVFSQKAFDLAFRNSLYEAIETSIKEALEKDGYSIRDNVELISPEKLKRINQEYTIENAEADIDKSPIMSPMITITDNRIPNIEDFFRHMKISTKPIQI